jgi:hypothetical protein
VTGQPDIRCRPLATGFSAAIGGLDLGEVTLRGPAQADFGPLLGAAISVEVVSFRKPAGAGALAAVCALARVSGPQLVFGDSAETVFVVWPNEVAGNLAHEWPW